MGEQSNSLSTALFAAAFAAVGWVVADFWKRANERSAIAGALAGEIGAYLENLKPSQTPANFRKIAKIPRDKRILYLAALSQTPDSHPVFDKVADRIGLLPSDLACEVSKFYNVVNGFRLQFGNLSSEKFLNADDELHAATLEIIAATIEEREPQVRDLIRRLEHEAILIRWPSFLLDRVPALKRRYRPKN